MLTTSPSELNFWIGLESFLFIYIFNVFSYNTDTRKNRTLEKLERVWSGAEAKAKVCGGTERPPLGTTSKYIALT